MYNFFQQNIIHYQSSSFDITAQNPIDPCVFPAKIIETQLKSPRNSGETIETNATNNLTRWSCEKATLIPKSRGGAFSQEPSRI